MVHKILHLDLDAFFCAVEEQRDPSLRGQPFAVGGRPEERGVVASCSYAARRFGVRSAMPMTTAVKLCPTLIIVERHFKDYRAASEQVMACLHEVTPLVEQISIDEAFLDVTDLPEPAERLARQLQGTINTRLNLPCSLGVATNKLLAKIANNIGKSGAQKGQAPNAILVVPPGQEAAFLAPLPAQELWGVGPKTAERLKVLGLQTIGDIAAYSEKELIRQFGKLGYDLARHARGIDERRIETEHETKSVSQETTFVKDVRDRETLCRTLRDLSEKVGKQLSQSALSGRTVKLKLRWANFTTLTRQVTLASPTDQSRAIYDAAVALFDKVWLVGKPVRLIGVGVSSFEAPSKQLSLWDAPAASVDEPANLKDALNRLRDRFGEGAVRRGSDLKRKQSAED
jgi:DNA polymerase-4